MLSVKDKIEQFKRDCKSNDYYTKAIMDLNERIEEYDVILTGISSPTGNTGPKCENARNPYASNKLEPMLKQEALIKERDEYIRRINEVNAKLMKIVDPVDRQMIVDLFIEKKYYKHLVEKYHYSDTSVLYRHANRIIARIV